MSDDLISRQDAINLLKKISDGYSYIEVETESAIKQFQHLPSAQPERKKGAWKPFDRTCGRSIYYCTACGEAEDCPTEMGKVIWRFCPNCGAEMKGEKDE